LLEAGIANCDVLLQGIDPLLFHPGDEEPDDERFILFSGGKFELRKGQDLVLRAFKALQDKYPDLWLVNCWYNLWPESMRLMENSRHIRFEAREGSWQEVMRRTYELNGLDASRIVTCDLMAPELLPELYRRTHLGVFPNRCEGGTNLVLMEYMACGRPAIASYASGHTDVVNEDNALLLKENAEFRIVGADQQPFAPRGGGDIDGRGGLRRQAVEEGGRRVGEVVGLHQHTADEQRIRIREGVFTPFGRNQLVFAWHDRGQPTTTRQPVEHLTRLVVGDAEDRHRFFNGDDRLLLPFQAQDES